jgi:hypothetical protein
VPTLQEQRLARFVDRDREMAIFCAMLESEHKPIMLIWGDSGIGKTSLLARMLHECAVRKIRKAEITWTDTRNHDYLGIMRKIRDDVGADALKAFTDLVNFFTVPKYELQVTCTGAAIHVGDGLRANGGQVGDVAGIVVKDVMLNSPRQDMAIPEAERMARLTDCFFASLGEATQGGLLVIFLDAIEKMSLDTEKWICSELVRAIGEGQLPNLRLVACGQRKPNLPEYKPLIEESQLQPLQLHHVVEYLGKLGVAEKDRELAAGIILQATGGKLSDMANLAEGIVMRQTARGPVNG